MTGWARVGIVFITLWWAACGLYIYDGYSRSTQIAASSGLDEALATEVMLGRGPINIERETGVHYIEAHDQIYVGALSGIIVPLLIFIVFFIVRWISAGFRSKA